MGRLAVAYVGAVPRPTDVEPLTDRDPSSTNARLPSEAGVPRRVHVPDSDPRAVAYVMGAAPNRLGVLADGRTLVERLLGTSDLSKAPERWRHPLFAAVALSLVQEVANRRLFSVVRARTHQGRLVPRERHGVAGERRKSVRCVPRDLA